MPKDKSKEETKQVRYPAAQSPGVLDKVLDALTGGGLTGEAKDALEKRKSTIEKRLKDAQK